MINVAEIYAKYGSMSVVCEDMEIKETFRNYVKTICAEAEIDEYCEVTTYMDAIVENGAPVNDEQMVAFLTFLSFLTCPGELFDGDDDSDVQFILNDDVIFDGSIGELKEKYGHYLVN